MFYLLFAWDCFKIKLMIGKTDTIYLDFDGTVTKTDSVATFLSTYAQEGWLEIEKNWIDGKINSKECMTCQLDLIKNLTVDEFNRFLNSIKLREGFVDFYNWAKENNKKITILSDGFDFFIDYVLRKEKLEIKYFANKLNIEEKNGYLSFKLLFPYENKNCDLDLGMCKCAKTQKGEAFLYAGDGLSDRCIAKKSNLLFARGSLKKFCIENNVSYIDFDNFYEIKDYLTEGNRVKCNF